MKTQYIKAGKHYEVAITKNRQGRMSIVIYNGVGWGQKQIIDVELPCKTGEYKDAFNPTVTVNESITVEVKK